jgi:hypothetical protein
MDLSQVSKGGKMKPPRILIYGQAGIGKTTFGAAAPKPIFLPIEDGLGKIEADAFPCPKSYTDVRDSLDALIKEDHDYKTVVVDSLDWLEPLVWDHTCTASGYKTIEQPGYGRGYVEALKYWREFLDRLNYLRDMKAMQTILVGHSIIREFKSPDTDSFDRYQIKLQQKAADLVCEHSDAILFANYKKSTMKSESRGGQRTRAIGTGERILYTEERPAWLAKNRYGLPPEMELSYDAFLTAIKDGQGK